MHFVYVIKKKIFILILLNYDLFGHSNKFNDAVDIPFTLPTLLHTSTTINSLLRKNLTSSRISISDSQKNFSNASAFNNRSIEMQKGSLNAKNLSLIEEITDKTNTTDILISGSRAYSAKVRSLDHSHKRNATKPVSSIRLRLNEPFFKETANFFHDVFNKEVKRIRIQPQRQCFQEGCFESHTFRITDFQKPNIITLKPVAPNLLVLNIISFDVDIVGVIDGNLQLLITSVPLTGKLIVTARQLIFMATFDLHKSTTRIPYLQMQKCQLETGFVDTRVAYVGLLTETINLKYKNELIAKSKEMITFTVCEQIGHIIKMEVNSRFRQIPRFLSVSQIINTITNNSKNDAINSRSVLLSEKNSIKGTNSIKNTRSRQFNYVHPQGSPYVLYWTRRRRRRDAYLRQPLVKMALQRRRSHNSSEMYHINKPINLVNQEFDRKSPVWHTLVVRDEGIATIEEIIPEKEEEEQQQKVEDFHKWIEQNLLLERRQNRQNMAHSVEEISENDQQKMDKNKLKNTVTLVESTKTVKRLQHQQFDETKNNSVTPIHASYTLRNSTRSAHSSEKEVITIPIKRENELLNDAYSRDNIKRSKTQDEKLTTSHSVIANNEGPGNLSTLLKFIDMDALGHIFVDMDFIDSSASTHAYTIGVNGDIFTRPFNVIQFAESIQETPLVLYKKSPSSSVSFKIGNIEEQLTTKNDIFLLSEFEAEHGNFHSFNTVIFPTTIIKRKSLEIAIAETTPNLLLAQAHRARLLKVHVGPKSPFFGNLLRTTCSVDEVCLSDSIPEIGEKHPDQQLEILIETIKAPKIFVTKDRATLHFIGIANFFLNNSQKIIGQIRFVGAAEIHGRMSPRLTHHLELSMKLTKLEIFEHVDFFDLPAQTLGGLRDAVRGALENAARDILADGVDIGPLIARFHHYGIGDMALQLTDDGIILLNANIDVYRFAFEKSANEREIIVHD